MRFFFHEYIREAPGNVAVCRYEGCSAAHQLIQQLPMFMKVKREAVENCTKKKYRRARDIRLVVFIVAGYAIR